MHQNIASNTPTKKAIKPVSANQDKQSNILFILRAKHRTYGARQDSNTARQVSRNAPREKRFHLHAFRQIVMLYQSYQIEAPFKVFFCKKDRSVWIQKDKKPQNPFEQNSVCGRLIQ